jgi:hypothetical protein
VKRTSGSVIVEASSGADQFTLKKNLTKNPLAAMISTVPHHLIRPQQALLS